MMNKAVILLSGGLDSVVSLAYLKDNYKKMLALTFDYSQKSVLSEINSAKQISKFYNIEHQIIKLDWLGNISKSVLNSSEEIPLLTEKELDDKLIAINSSEAVWVPNRNALFINVAASFAEAFKYNDIIIGANKEEGETFIDNSIEFINSINNSLKYSVNFKIEVKAPLINMTKNDIVKKGIELNIPFEYIYSCYRGTNKHCGQCESCLRLKKALKNCSKIDIIKNIFE